MGRRILALPLLASVWLALLVVCMPASAANYTIGGTLNGLVNSSIALRLNSAETLTLTDNGSFKFATLLAASKIYSVSILTQPANQRCTVSKGSGLATTDINTVSINCEAPLYRIGGTVEGIAGTARLQLNGDKTVLVNANGSFEFSTTLPSQQAYSVAILSKPAGQLCELANASGTISNANVSDIRLVCTDINYSVGGAVSGLVGELALQLNNTTPLTLTSNGSFQFPTSFIAGDAYSVTITSTPVGQQCTILFGSGKIVAANISSIRISCTQLTYRVSGTVEGLAGTLRLTLNGGGLLILNANGSFQFATRLTHQQAYNVAITAKPANQQCTITNGSGAINAADVANVNVRCVDPNTPYRVGGTISGLVGTATVQINNGETLTLNANGSFQFATTLINQQAYSVAVVATPNSQNCAIVNASGVIASANVSNINVTCSNVLYSVGGNVNGLAGEIVLQLNNSAPLTVNTSGSYQFPASLALGDAYGITIVKQPVGQQCNIASGTATGTMPATNVSNINISCTPLPYRIGGSISGLAGTAQIQLNDGETLSVTASGNFQFATTLTHQQIYKVALVTQPTGQQCAIANNNGTVAAANVDNIEISCSNIQYRVGGAVSGLNGSLTLQLNGSEALTLNSGGSFQFTNALTHSQTYNVVLMTQPIGQQCAVSNGSGSISAADVSGISVSCENLQYHVGGSVSGLNGALQLQLNGAEPLSISSNGNFQFPATLLHGAAYSAAISTQPVGQQCVIANQSGNVNAADVGGISVSCESLQYRVGGSITGLKGELQLQLNGGTPFAVGSNGNFQFPTTLLHGAAYSVAISKQPVGQQCAVTNQSGNINATDINSINISCENLQYHVGGVFMGLNEQLQLQLNGGTPLAVSSNSGTFQFPATVPYGAAYSVAISSQPVGQQCTITNGSGTIGASDVSNISIDCTNLQYTLSGTVTGLVGTLQLKIPSRPGYTGTISVSKSGVFSFLATFTHRASYTVVISSQPVGQQCVIVNNSGQINAANVTNIQVTCTTGVYHVAGTVSGLVGQLGLKLNGGATLSLSSNGIYQFPTNLSNGDTYSVTVSSQPMYQVCTISNAGGTINSSHVSNANVSCVTTQFRVGGTVNGLNGTINLRLMPLAATGSGVTSVSANGSFAFTGTLSNQTPYQVVIMSQPTGQQCTVINGSGKISNAHVTDVQISCVSLFYSVGGNVNGLVGTLGLKLNGLAPISLSSNGVYQFPNTLLHGVTYGVSISSQPLDEQCTVINGSGVINAANVVNVNVSCVSRPYRVASRISGLFGELVVQLNGEESKTIGDDGTHYFTTTLRRGDHYSIDIMSQPSNQGCTAGSAQGEVASEDLIVDIDCVDLAQPPLITHVWPRQVLTGDEVKVSGSYLDDAAVSFAGITVEPTLRNAHELRFIVPDSVPGTYAIEVQNAQGVEQRDIIVGDELRPYLEVSAGLFHACGVTSSYQLRCWGNNGSGQLGIGTTGVVYTAQDVPLTSVSKVSAGDFHTCATLMAGQVYCWGYNSSGQLGIGNAFNKSTPQIVSGIYNTVAVSAGSAHSCAVSSSGTVTCWGDNAYGQLGDGTVTGSYRPVVVTGLTGAVDVSVGRRHSCALLSSGAVRCWGAGEYGQLGQGAFTSSSTPVAVSNLGQAWAIDVGDDYSCALLISGRLQCWGTNDLGQLGVGVIERSAAPVTVNNLETVTKFDAGVKHACAVSGSSTVKCWGDNTYKQISVDALTKGAVVEIHGLPNDVSVVAGKDYSCAWRADEGLRCWGYDAAGRLGRAAGGPAEGAATQTIATPAQVIGKGTFHSCALFEGGEVRCWGDNTYGQLGVAGIALSHIPVPVPGLADVVSLGVGGSRSCALLDTGDIRCWGAIHFGWDDVLTPANLVPGAKSVAAAETHACALLDSGAVKCWGGGVLGDGSNTASTTPVTVAGISDAVAVATGIEFSCAVLATGSVQCWGANYQGQLGDGTYEGSLTPVTVVGISNAISVSIGELHACALLSTGAISCWGSNYYGQLGDTTTVSGPLPVTVAGISNATQISTGSRQSCALLKSKQVVCWGKHDYGQPGRSSIAVPVLNNVRQIVAGDFGTCALLRDGAVQCWGVNVYSEIGLPTVLPAPGHYVIY